MSQRARNKVETSKSDPIVPLCQKIIINIKIVPFCHNEICQFHPILRNGKKIAGITLALSDLPVDAANHADRSAAVHPDDSPSI